ncbi:riboflavin biosynthesis protein VVA0006-like isoform X2 [Ostrea edulis]|uniref:riboflavin biosynthesis protein VVA0006-like isoform X2 n=1 Tax=Ostrea edulis TaxID=37623 RepID=UPI0024AF3BC7|nr:riboflavin biosynthesis protein VVA0006-like isoform X2 [Ostrea edulis]
MRGLLCFKYMKMKRSTAQICGIRHKQSRISSSSSITEDIVENGNIKTLTSEKNESSLDSRVLPASLPTNHKPLACKDEENGREIKKVRKEESISILKQEYSKDRPEHFYHFYGKDSPFSNFHPARFTLEGIAYSCSEQYMMYQKAVLFHDEKQAKEILKASDPLTMKMLGRKVKHFDDDVWTKRCVDIVKTGVLAKFKQNQHLERALIDTYPRILAEATPRSPLWGIGLGLKDPQINSRRSWRGKNWLGYLLTDVRNQIMEERGLFS